jgi:superfamily II DNA/RNA helicase
LKTLLLRRIGSSLHAGLLTAKRLRDGNISEAAKEEDETVEASDVRDVDMEAIAHLEQAIQGMESAGDGDPKLSIILNNLRGSGWANRGCILFSQYLDTVLWIAGHLAMAFPTQLVGVYAGQGNSYLYEADRRRSAGREEITKLVDGRILKLLVATDAASEGLNLQKLQTLINIDLPWNPARLEQRKGRIDRIGQQAVAVDILNLRYRGSVEDDVHHALSARLESIRDVFGTVPDTLEDVWVLTALGLEAAARERINAVPPQHPFELRYGQDMPQTSWERCEQVLERNDIFSALKHGWQG